MHAVGISSCGPVIFAGNPYDNSPEGGSVIMKILILFLALTVLGFIASLPSGAQEKKAEKKSLLLADKEIAKLIEGISSFPYDDQSKKLVERATDVFNKAEAVVEKNQKEVVELLTLMKKVVDEGKKMVEGEGLVQKYRPSWNGEKWIVSEIKKEERKSLLKENPKFAPYVKNIASLTFPADWRKTATAIAENLSELEKAAKEPKMGKHVEDELRLISENVDKARKLNLEGPYVIRWNGFFWLVKTKAEDKK